MQTTLPADLKKRIFIISGFRIYGGPSESRPASVDLWVNQFLKMKQSIWFVRIDYDFLADIDGYDFVYEKIPCFNEAYELLTDSQSDKWEMYDKEEIAKFNNAAITLYQAIHYQWSLTPVGMKQIEAKLLKGDFGVCPRYKCNNQHLLPQGCFVNYQVLFTYCPQCEDVYHANTDQVECPKTYCYHHNFPKIFLSCFPQHNANGKFVQFEPRPLGFKFNLSRHNIMCAHTSESQ